MIIDDIFARYGQIILTVYIYEIYLFIQNTKPLKHRSVNDIFYYKIIVYSHFR